MAHLVLKKINFLAFGLTIFSLTLLSCGQNNSDSNSQDSDLSSNFDSSSFDASNSNETSSEEELPNGYSLKDETTYNGSCSFIKNYEGNYYASISGELEGDSLLNNLSYLLNSIDNYSGFTYKRLFDIFKYTDAYDFSDLGNQNKITSFYSGKCSSRSSMNRERVWPNSRGGGFIEDDPHMVRPTLTSENSARGNAFFNENMNFDPASFSNEKYRGITARIVFYCAVKQKDNGLRLVNKNDDSYNKNDFYQRTMGNLNTLLKWNIEYPIDDSELLRNNYLFDKYNWCRNPFIDDRNYACKIWGKVDSTTMATCGIRS